MKWDFKYRNMLQSMEVTCGLCCPKLNMDKCARSKFKTFLLYN